MDDKSEEHGPILLVEEDRSLGPRIKRFLSDKSYSVDLVRSNRGALKRLKARSYDVVITELSATGIDGFELTVFIRKNFPHCQVVILSAKGSKDLIIEALRQGVSDYIEKPFDLEFILVNVEKVLEKADIMKELIRLSQTDGLTGLYNQRHFYTILDKEMKRARRQNETLSLLLADVDFFKKYNDKNGHLQGDEALKKMANSLKEACRRDVDMAFRYGGDEFIIILTGADLSMAMKVAERIHALLADLNLDGLTMSIGLAELLEEEDLKGFIRRADEAMYVAKKMGGKRPMTFGSKMAVC